MLTVGPDYGRPIDRDEPLPLPIDPVLADYSSAFNAAGHWAYVVDASFSVVYATDEWRRTVAGLDGLARVPLGHFHFGPEACDVMREWTTYNEDFERQLRESFANEFPVLMEIFHGDRDALRTRISPMFVDLVDSLPEQASPLAYSWQQSMSQAWGISTGNWLTWLKIHDNSGHFVGAVRITKPAAGMSLIGTIASGGDVRHLERIQEFVTAARRPGAILFADLEASSALARALPTNEYFSLARRLVRIADQCVVDAGGVVGRHLGDGITAYFLTETLGTESATARACIEAARNLKDSVREIAQRSGIATDDLVLRFGLHWGSTLYVGLIKSIARSEVTGLGNEVNEAARIEACASGGRVLASKSLVERLNPTDARLLGIETPSYTSLGDLQSATDKARRDASTIAVCEI